MIKTAEILKKQREEKGISLNEVSIALKINIKTLQAIEDADLTKLPALSFLRGFVRSYAQYLKLDINEVLKVFNEEMHVEAKPIMPVENQQEKTQNKNSGQVIQFILNSPLKKVFYIVTILILVTMIFVIKSTIEKYEREKQTTQVQVEPIVQSDAPTVSTEVTASATPTQTTDTNVVTENPTSTTTPNLAQAPSPTPATAQTATTIIKPTPTPEVKITPTPTPVAKVVATPAPTVVPKATATPVAATIATPKPTTTPAVVATPKPTATPTPVSTPKPIPTPSPTPSPTATPTPKPSPSISGRPQEVIIEALDKVEITYSLDGGAEQKMTLNPDQVHSFKAKANVKINVNNAGAINVIQNGRDRGVPGNLGKSMTLTYQ